MVSSASPEITSLTWGRIEVKGHGVFKDVKLYPGGATEWDWNKTGTHHSPGIQPADIEELLDREATVLVLSRGMLSRLKTCSSTLKRLEDAGITTHVLQTERAVQLYNDLRQTESVAGLFHSTC